MNIANCLTTRVSINFQLTRLFEPPGVQTFGIIIKLRIVQASSKKNLESLDNLVEKQMHPLFIIRDAFPSSVKREKAVITLERRSARSRNTTRGMIDDRRPKTV